jgi:RNA polymerase sigma-70 factor, ECF subfamily
MSDDGPQLIIETLLAETPVLLAYARARLHDYHEAEEAVQDCLLAAWAQRETFAGRSTIRTWLVGILRHKLLDRLRARRRRPDRPDPSAPAPADHDDNYDPLDACFTAQGSWRIDPTFAMSSLSDCPQQSALRSELRALLRLCLDGLPTTLRRLFSLRELDQLDTREAASLAGVSAASAPVLLTRARRAHPARRRTGPAARPASRLPRYPERGSAADRPRRPELPRIRPPHRYPPGPSAHHL